MQTVNQATPKFTVVASLYFSSVGQSVTVTATVLASPSGPILPTGTVTFTLPDGTVLGSVAVSSGKAKLTTSTLPAGCDDITATYGGDSNFTGNAAIVTEVVQ